MSMRWYVVHAYSGQEKSIQQALIDRIKRSGMADKFGEVLVPTEEVVEMKSGQKAISERRFFPGYILVQMDMTDETWHLVKSTPKVTGFIGGSAIRPPISDKEVNILTRCRRRGSRSPVLFEVGERCASPKARSRLQRQRRGSELREEQDPSGADFRPRDAGGWFRAGEKA
jgi:transcriptional antiterminator NusG